MDIWYRRYTAAGFPTPINQWTQWFRSVMEQTDNTFTSGTHQQFDGSMGLGIQTGVTIPTGGGFDGIITLQSTYPPVLELASGQDQEVRGMMVSSIDVGTIVIVRNSSSIRMVRHLDFTSDSLRAPFDFSGWDFKDWIMPRYGVAAFRLHDNGFNLVWRPIWISGHGGIRFRGSDAIAANTTIQGYARKIGNGQSVHILARMDATASVTLAANDPLFWLPDSSGSPGGGSNTFLPPTYFTLTGYGHRASFYDASAGTWNEINISIRTSGQVHTQQGVSLTSGDLIILDNVYQMSNTSDTMTPIV